MTEADLIEDVRVHELLWDPKNKDYHNKHQRDIVWSVIQKKFGPAKGKFTYLLLQWSTQITSINILFDTMS